MKQMYEIDCVICILNWGEELIEQTNFWFCMYVERKLDPLFSVLWISEYSLN